MRQLILRVATVVMATTLALGPAAARAGTGTTAVPDAYEVAEDGVLVVTAPGLLDNDLPDGAALCVIGFGATDSLQGTLSGTDAKDGSFTYTPSPDFNGTGTFEYAMAEYPPEGSCPDALQSTAIVTITVTPVNDAPSATADSFQALANHTLHVNAPGVLSNDSDIDGDQLRATKVNNPAHGTVVLAEDGEFSYTPSAGYAGPDAFSYKAGDGSAFSPIRVVSLTVSTIPTPPPPPPTATPAPTLAPTPEPTATPEVTAIPTVEVTPATTEGPVATPPAASATTGPSPTAAPGSAADQGGLPPLPVLIVILVFVILVAFAASIYIPRWLRSQSGEPLDPE